MTTVNHAFYRVSVQALTLLERLHQYCLTGERIGYHPSRLCAEAEAAIVAMRIELADLPPPSAPAEAAPAFVERRRAGSDPFNTTPRRRKTDWPEITHGD
jgi:hypothetical protein